MYWIIQTRWLQYTSFCWLELSFRYIHVTVLSKGWTAEIQQSFFNNQTFLTFNVRGKTIKCHDTWLIATGCTESVVYQHTISIWLLESTNIINTITMLSLRCFVWMCLEFTQRSQLLFKQPEPKLQIHCAMCYKCTVVLKAKVQDK